MTISHQKQNVENDEEVLDEVHRAAAVVPRIRLEFHDRGVLVLAHHDYELSILGSQSGWYFWLSLRSMDDKTLNILHIVFYESLFGHL